MQSISSLFRYEISWSGSSSWIAFSLLVCLCALAPERTSAAKNDPLNQPSIKVQSEKITSSSLMDVTRLGKRLIVVGERGYIFYSDNQGKNWSQADVPTSIALTAVNFPTAEKGWAVGHSGVVLHSGDGGKSWKKQLDGSQVNGLMLAQVEQLIQSKTRLIATAEEDKKEVLEIDLDNLKYFLSDAKLAVEEGPTRPFMDLWFRDVNEGIVVGAFGMIIQTTDGGHTWEPIIDRIDNPDGFHYYSIGKYGDTLYIAGEAGMLFSSKDDGQNWTRLDLTYEGSLFGVTGQANGSLVVAFGLRGNGISSIDGGLTWKKLNTVTNSSFMGGTFLPDGTLILIGSDGSVVRSEDGGGSFNLLQLKVPGAISIEMAGSDLLAITGLGGVRLIDLKSLK